LLAGPGSGKTKTLTIKLARIFSDDIEEPDYLAARGARSSPKRFVRAIITSA
jgi:hypothetical protein